MSRTKTSPLYDADDALDILRKMTEDPDFDYEAALAELTPVGEAEITEYTDEELDEMSRQADEDEAEESRGYSPDEIDAITRDLEENGDLWGNQHEPLPDDEDDFWAGPAADEYDAFLLDQHDLI